MTIKRYWSLTGGDASMQETETGNFVKYDDYAALAELVRLLTEQRDAVVAECQSKKSALEAILEHCPVNHPHIDAACAAMIAYDNLHCVETPATSAILDSLRAEGVEMFAVTMHADISDADALEFARQLRESKGANHED